MKYTKILALIFALTFSTFACTTGGLVEDKAVDPVVPPVDPPNTLVEVIFISQLQSKVQSGSEFKIEAGDEFGKFMLRTGGSLNGEGVLGIHPTNKPNLKYSAAANGILSPSKDDQTMFFPLDKTQLVDFVSYFPYNAGASDVENKKFTIPVDISDQNSRSIYALFSNNAKKLNKEQTNVLMQYKYALSKINVAISISTESGITSSDIAGMTMAVTNIPTAATFDLTNQTCLGHTNVLVHDETSNTGGLFANMAPDGLSGELVIIPMNIDQHTNLMFVFKLTNGKVYNYPIDSKQNFLSGTNYKFSINFKNESVDVSTEIVEWIPGLEIVEELE